MGYLKKLGALLAIGLLSVPMLAAPVHAQDISTELDSAALAAEFSDEPLAATIGDLIKVFLTLLGIILLVLVIYAGFLWMTAGGESDKTQKAKDIMINAVIGLIILLAAYAISNFVITSLTTAGLAG
ncbi:hypothetical protein HN358_02880 [Candidatus Uhrbacteria bacterium]|jgi:hypothetical protein|nr:hypothetical protein [Candidatus Uhrbacteria bacterium]MBT7717145.1 hypothetical protein [Candidatus Uhrbacteria bacterium]